MKRWSIGTIPIPHLGCYCKVDILILLHQLSKAAPVMREEMETYNTYSQTMVSIKGSKTLQRMRKSVSSSMSYPAVIYLQFSNQMSMNAEHQRDTFRSQAGQSMVRNHSHTDACLTGRS